MSLSERMYETRINARLTQQQLAERMSVSIATINRWERGHNEPNPTKLRQLAQVFNLSVQYLSTGVEVNTHKFPLAEQHGKIAFQGRIGAYSHLSVLACYPNYQAIACHSFDEAFTMVQNGQADLAMIPIENSLGGRVADIHLLLPQSNLYIIAEHYQPISHCLMVLPGVKRLDIESVISHPQALSQCRHRLKQMGLIPEDFADTAGAAQYISENKIRNKAAIASKIAAEYYGLEIIQEKFEDKSDNITRFIVLSREKIVPDPLSVNCITSMIFSLRSIPAALYKCLGGFATNQVNLIKLESYIPLHRNQTAEFYTEFLGHPNDPNVRHAIDELNFFSENVKILGTYAKNRP